MCVFRSFDDCAVGVAMNTILYYIYMNIFQHHVALPIKGVITGQPVDSSSTRRVKQYMNRGDTR